uniref:PBZ-type domain-containing protein n=1 Tax=Gasterosteus aculeatus aculeatus TaxID=481459 RepID=A0AAQ4R8X2_GASAC
MSGFDLVRVDAGGGGPIRLPPGETVLGRGPLLGVSDKRVSRLHGLLENLDGELRLKPTHLNPCFVQASPTDDPRPLQRNSWHQLRHGDLFSLLPGRLIFQVEAVGGEGRTPRNGRLFVEGGLPLDPEPDVESPPSPAQEKEEEEEEADRPECPYGTDCYRKNPLHRKEYKHTKRPARAARTAPGKPPAEEDEDEYEDSFIDDSSGDAGDDSDYAPPASDDSGREDVAALREEAKAFTRRRK